MNSGNNYIKVFIAIIIMTLVAAHAHAQDSVRAKILRVAEKTIVYKINGMRFVSFDCKCGPFKKGDVFTIPKSRFDSLLLQAKPVRRKDMQR